MSDQKAFAKFPAAGGGYQYIDIFAIEAIGQSVEPSGAVIFGATERYYQIVIPKDELERSGEPDAASWALSLVSKVARASMPHVDLGEADDEDDFVVPFQPPSHRPA